MTYINCENFTLAGTSVSPDPFDLTSLENGLSNSPVPRSNSRNATNSPHIDTTKKTPQAFLGENSSLVNLDNLITTPAVPPLPAIATQKTGNNIIYFQSSSFLRDVTT